MITTIYNVKIVNNVIFQNVCFEIVCVVHTLSIFVRCQIVNNGEHYQQTFILSTLSTTLNLVNTVNK